MELACNCYARALEAENLPTEDKESLISRHGNVRNELGVFFMNQATALVQKVSTEMDPETSPTSGRNKITLKNCNSFTPAPALEPRYFQ
jgi:hypothetical protein